MSEVNDLRQDPLRSFRLDGKAALVTGGSPGLERAMVLGLAGDASSYRTGAVLRVDGGHP